MQDINTDGIFPELAEKGFLFRAKDEQTKEHQHNRRHPEDTDERCKGKQLTFQLCIGGNAEEEYPQIFLYPSSIGNQHAGGKQQNGRQCFSAFRIVDDCLKLLLLDVIPHEEEGQKVNGAGKA